MNKHTSYLNKQWVFFDWDGCLADTLSIWIKSYDLVCKKYDVHLNETELANFLGNPADQLRIHGIVEAERATQEVLHLADEMLQEPNLNIGARKCLDTLTDMGYKLALVSSASRQTLTKGLAHNGLGQHFEVIVSGSDVIRYKPDPEPIHLAISQANTSAPKVVFIGDSENDILAANNADIDVILYRPDKNLRYYPNSTENLTYSKKIKNFEVLTALLTT